MTAKAAKAVKAVEKVDLRFTYSRAQYYMFFGSAADGRFRIFPKGRRLGATRGAAQAFIEYMSVEGWSCLWGDTINGNIDRYVERYFMPILLKLPTQLPWHWDKQKRLLKVGRGYTDFRSADRPENWEGFGYHIVFLNEAGIILDDEYLYYNAVLPMLMDYPDSQLIAAGTPKMATLTGKLFRDLWTRVENKEPGYCGCRYTTYSNPFLSADAIDALAKEIPDDQRRQEIFGQFIAHPGGNILKAKWWQRWLAKRPLPHFEFVFQSWDTAYTEEDIKTNAYSARSTWGVFRNDKGDLNLMLCECWRGRVDYPDLKRIMKEGYQEYAPDTLLIEYKSSGISILQDLKREGFPVQRYLPDKDRSKVARAYTVQAMLEAGQVWAPERRWADTFIEDVAAFPFGESADWTDSMTQALLFVKRGLYLLQAPEGHALTDEYREDRPPPRRAAYG